MMLWLPSMAIILKFNRKFELNVRVLNLITFLINHPNIFQNLLTFGLLPRKFFFIFYFLNNSSDKSFDDLNFKEKKSLEFLTALYNLSLFPPIIVHLMRLDNRIVLPKSNLF